MQSKLDKTVYQKRRERADKYNSHVDAILAEMLNREWREGTKDEDIHELADFVSQDGERITVSVKTAFGKDKLKYFNSAAFRERFQNGSSEWTRFMKSPPTYILTLYIVNDDVKKPETMGTLVSWQLLEGDVLKAEIESGEAMIQRKHNKDDCDFLAITEYSANCIVAELSPNG